MECCEKLGAQNPSERASLWLETLKFLGESGEKCSPQISKVLDAIEKENLASPLVALSALSQNKNVTFGDVKRFLKRFVEKQSEKMLEAKKISQEFQVFDFNFSGLKISEILSSISHFFSFKGPKQRNQS